MLFGIVLTPVTAIIGLVVCALLIKLLVKFIVANIRMDYVRLKHTLAKVFIVLDCIIPLYLFGYIAREYYNVSMVKILIACWIVGYLFYLMFMTKETQTILYLIFGSIWGYYFYSVFAAPTGVLGAKLCEKLITYGINIDCLAYKAVMSGFLIYVNIRCHFFFQKTSDFTQYYLFKKNKNKKKKHINADLPVDDNTTTP